MEVEGLRILPVALVLCLLSNLKPEVVNILFFRLAFPLKVLVLNLVEASVPSEVKTARLSGPSLCFNLLDALVCQFSYEFELSYNKFPCLFIDILPTDRNLMGN